jgi:acyl dehydratase
VRARDAETGSPLFTATTGLFVRGQGGCGGARGARGPRAAPPARAPDQRVETPTLPIQTLLYRHAGNDANAIHLDPEVARRAGFRAPILTGLNTLGIACRALVHAVCDSQPERLRSLAGRFASPGYNGDRLCTEVWCGDDLGRDERGQRLVCYRVLNQEGSVLLDAGRAAIA